MSTFALKRGYELQLPNSYVGMDREEMEYVDGGGVGRNWWNSTNSVGNAIDCIIYLVPALSAMNTAMKLGRLASVGRSVMVAGIQGALKKAKKDFAIQFAVSAVNVLLTLSGMSVGKAIATALDRVDGSYDTYVFA
ncbi:hypothetical protein [Clostridium gasigenes]|uniref:Uncharacterized protein n=1 Tax=Clostridium gasigenes TaxID=94869 RepID=A0A1H0TA87_9CLOT|nr:hypothetical protein [Clostridium gasigenes]SDP50528.1 hypothetical protein SAMN04488529_106138 [Clostridium gasigenes]